MTWNQNDLWRERYRALFDGNVAGIIVTNIDGHIVDCNESFARIFAFESQEEVLGLGVGLPTENVDRIFSAFYTTKAQGSGMGLAISR